MKLALVAEATSDRSEACDPGLEDFITAYIEAALWSSCDDSDVPLDANYSAADLHPWSRHAMRKDCAAFYAAYRELWPDLGDVQAGHDFWLTRNHHGVGFWDRHCSNGAALTAAAHAYGVRYLCVDTDGTLHCE